MQQSRGHQLVRMRWRAERQVVAYCSPFIPSLVVVVVVVIVARLD